MYRMSDGTVVNPEKSVKCWVSKATGSEWEHEILYKTRKGRYYLEMWSDWQGSIPHAEWVSHEEAARWLLLQGRTLPPDLEALRETIEE